MDEGISLGEVFKVTLKNIKIILCVLIITVSIFFAVSFLEKSKYNAKGSVLVIPEEVDTGGKYYLGSESIILTINSFIKRDFILKNTIEELNLECTIQEFPKIYKLSSYVENNFINISCESINAENNILIINSVIEGLIASKNKIPNREINIIVTEHASYNIVLSSSRPMYLLVGVIVACILALGIVLYKIIFSPYIQSEDEVKRLLSNTKTQYFNLHKTPLSVLLDNTNGAEVVLLNRIPESSLKEFQALCQSDCIFVSSNDYETLDIKKLKKEYAHIFIISNDHCVFHTEADLIYDFIRVGRIKKAEILQCISDTFEKKLLISI